VLLSWAAKHSGGIAVTCVLTLMSSGHVLSGLSNSCAGMDADSVVNPRMRSVSGNSWTRSVRRIRARRRSSRSHKLEEASSLGTSSAECGMLLSHDTDTGADDGREYSQCLCRIATCVSC
jgi:hypothetical protein